MRDFSEADKEKKRERIKVKDNPAGLPVEKLTELETAVKSSLKDGYLSCPVAWQIAQKEGVPRIAVGAVTDRLGIRVADCQLGCFKVDKTPYDNSVPKEVEEELSASLDTLNKDGKLACAGAFELAKRFKVPPMAVSDALNVKSMKIRDCQLGCF